MCTLPSVASEKWGEASRTLPGMLCLLIKRDPKRWALLLLDIVRVRVPELWQLPWDHREQCEDGRAERWEEHACLMKSLKSWLNPEAERLPALYLDESLNVFLWQLNQYPTLVPWQSKPKILYRERHITCNIHKTLGISSSSIHPKPLLYQVWTSAYMKRCS